MEPVVKINFGCLKSVALCLMFGHVIICLAVHSEECEDTYFGWRCQFKCNCKGSGSCDREDGRCEDGCDDNHWGPGCLLDNQCAYNDPTYEHYQGHMTRTKHGYSCVDWTEQSSYPGNHFIDGSKTMAKNYCRNPQPLYIQPWCYYRQDQRTDWDICDIKFCDCPVGRFGLNCLDECHCKDVNEACDQLTGACQSGCDDQWKGSECQEQEMRSDPTEVTCKTCWTLNPETGQTSRTEGSHKDDRSQVIVIVSVAILITTRLI